ncbi:MAG: hypothetical protein RSD36_16780 [Terrisporobacter sp.]
MKLKTKQKIIALCAMGMITIGSAGVSFANNHNDSTYTFNFGTLNGSRYTDGRKKEDASKSYMNCKTMTSGYSYKAKVQANIGGGERKDVGSPSYTFVTGTTRRMTNYVLEKGYRAATIKANSGINTKDTRATGVWSPDSYQG